MAKGDVGFRQQGTLGFLDFPRDVTAQTRETAYAAYNELARARIKALSFNFGSTDYMNSAGIGLIINLVEDATQAGRRVYAFGLGSHYRKLFNMVGLTERIALVADEHEARQKAADQLGAELPGTGNLPPTVPSAPPPAQPGVPPPAQPGVLPPAQASVPPQAQPSAPPPTPEPKPPQAT